MIPKRPASAKASASVAKKTRLDPDQPVCQDTVCLQGPFTLKSYILHKDKEDGKMKLEKKHGGKKENVLDWLVKMPQ